MTKKELLKTLIRDFHLRDIPTLKPRLLDIPLHLNKVVTLTGVRRSGKSSILLQAIEQLRQTVPREQIVYLNFEDERLDLATHELDLIVQAYRELYPALDLAQCYFFFDEIQNISRWELFVRRLDDSVSRHLFITGSNSKLLGSEIATALRGRTLRYEVFPLSFGEYLAFQGIVPDLHSSQSVALINVAFEQFMLHGGFPEVVLLDDDNIRRKLLTEYFDVMIYRDLIERYQERNVQALKFFLRRCIESVTSPLSINKIHNELKSAGFRVSKDTLHQYLEQANAIYLLQLAYKYDPSLVRRELGDKKAYIVDNGLINAFSWRAGQDKGKLLENLMAMELRKQGLELLFVKGAQECDFVVQQATGELLPMQVCYELGDPTTRAREVAGLLAACRFCGVQQGVIVTRDEDAQWQEDGVMIRVVAAWRYLL
ncbi:ATP-binding protein [Thiothrix subterranea]|uniref:ATP-binding protein n=1 Tax=Thiothrix subterranea TaxID=2735563 RepID=UPI00192B832E|nr:ATP-binding protein [Thiothrix subterranea]QQZ30135.1 ATP-binding protein [Thiothrix subterranea]